MEYKSCGYYLDYTKKLADEIEGKFDINLQMIIDKLTTFSIKEVLSNQNDISLVDFDVDLEPTVDKLIAVYENLITRGLPTYPSLFIERSIIQSIKPKIPVNFKDKVSFEFEPSPLNKPGEDDWVKNLIKAHLLFNPDVEFHLPSEVFDSKEECKFYNEILPETLGEEVLQIIDVQRNLNTLISETSETNYTNQKVDFTVDFNSIKFIIEIDGEQHQEKEQREKDKKRDNILAENGWKIIRIPAEKVRTGDVNSYLTELKNELQHDSLYELAKEINQKSLINQDLGKKAYQTVLVPFQIARIQTALIQAMKNTDFSLKKDEWNLVFHERDIPCSQIAVIDFYNNLQKLIDLMDLEINLPQINILAINKDKYYDLSLNINKETKSNKISYQRISPGSVDKVSFSGDLFIDISLFLKNHYRQNYDLMHSLIHSEGAALSIRSSQFMKKEREVNYGKPIKYNINKEKMNELKFFLQNIFRKEKFREGQFEIIKRSLELKSVIGLLPTGGGKSLCYQFSALLQPGITLVIEPIKSLMYDQWVNLKEFGIDNVQYISSDLSKKEREKAVEDLGKGKYQISLISPERLQIEKFRNSLEQLTTNIPVAYFVIDEAHCVSEWGHDFRPSYLHLDRVAAKFCSHDDYCPPFIALTGTASFAVLTDIQRELNIESEKAQVTPDTFDRPELKYSIYKVPSDKKEEKMKGILKSIPKKFGVSKNKFFSAEGENIYSGIIFAPHVNGKYGVYRLSKKVKKYLNIPVKYYCGKSPKGCDLNYKEFDKYKQNIQQNFKDNEISLLVATKSFGMGIDKPNIRYTIHYGMPQSLEEFYQQSGRAGRDGNDALCILIFSDDNSQHANKLLDPDLSADDLSDIKELSWGQRGDVQRIMWFHKKSFEGEETEFSSLNNKLLKKYIEPEFKDMNDGESKKITIGYNYKYRSKIETGLHRLSIIDLIRDYTVDFSHKRFKVHIVKQPQENYVNNIKDYISLYKTREYTARIPDMVKNMDGKNLMIKTLKFLIKFIYDEIEKKRRNAIRTIVEVCRKSETGEDIRRDLIAYLEESPFTEPLKEIAQEIKQYKWWDLLDEVQDIEQARTLLFGARRRLESSPDHPGLHFIIGFARLLLNNNDEEEFISDIRQGISHLSKHISNETEILRELIYQFDKRFNDLDNYPDLKTKLANLILDKSPDRKLAKKLHENAPDKANEVLLKSSLKHLKDFNKTFLEGY
ncbi:MAG: RecQ family ATP-dependent DNA helicase [bacterium]